MVSVTFAGGCRLLSDRPRFFSNPLESTKDGLVAINDEMSVDILKEAYGLGIFPWPHEDYPVLWFSPDPRGVLYFNEVHLSKSFLKFLKNCDWEVTWNEDFSGVIKSCAEVRRPSGEGTWINPHLMTHYQRFHQSGFSHSVEVWSGDELVGGMYGVLVDGCFSGESMFFKVSQASKVALLAAIVELREIGLKWMDIQMVTPNLQALGGRYISRLQFYSELAVAQENKKLLKALTPRRSSVRSVISRWSGKNVE